MQKRIMYSFSKKLYKAKGQSSRQLLLILNLIGHLHAFENQSNPYTGVHSESIPKGTCLFYTETMCNSPLVSIFLSEMKQNIINYVSILLYVHVQSDSLCRSSQSSTRKEELAKPLSRPMLLLPCPCRAWMFCSWIRIRRVVQPIGSIPEMRISLRRGSIPMPRARL